MKNQTIYSLILLALILTIFGWHSASAQPCIVPYPAHPTAPDIKLDWQSDATHEAACIGIPTIGDLDGDGMPEIVVAGQSINSNPPYTANEILIFKGDGSNPTAPDVITANINSSGFSALILEIGDGGNPEVIFKDVSNNIRIFTYNNSVFIDKNIPVIGSALYDYNNCSLSAADFNQDGIPELYSGNNIWSFNIARTLLTLSADADNALQSPFNEMNGASAGSDPTLHHSVAADILPASQDCPNCGGLELICGPAIYAIDLGGADPIEDQVNLSMNILVQGKLTMVDYGYLPIITLNNLRPSTFNDGFTGVADMNLDGNLDVIVNGGFSFNSGSTQQGSYIYSPATLEILGVFPGTGTSNEYGGKVSIANVYHDEHISAAITNDFPELLVTEENKIRVLNLNRFFTDLNGGGNGSPNGMLWEANITDGSGNTSVTAFDLNGDGFREIIYRDEQRLRLMFGGDLSAHPGSNRVWAAELASSRTGIEHPVVADVDNDGHAEIITVSGVGGHTAVNGTVRVYEAVNDDWEYCRPIWNQSQYFIVPVDDQLVVESPQPPSHQETPPGSGLWDLNMFLMQRNLHDTLANATLDIVGYSCQTDEIGLYIYNAGTSVLPVGMPISFYEQDPTQNTNPGHLNTYYTPSAIPSGTSQTLTYILPGLSNLSNICVYVNDYAMGPFPMTGPPQFSYDECDYSDNLACIPINCPTVDPCEQLGLTALFSWTANGLTLTATDQSSGGSIFQTYYDWGDGTGTFWFPQTPFSHPYTAPGIYNVCLTAWSTTADGDICEATYCEEIMIEPCELHLPAFSWFAGNISNPLEITFVDNTYPYNTNAIWVWDDGTSNGTTTYPTTTINHTFPGNGTYTVCMTGTFIPPGTGIACPCSTICQEVTIGSTRGGAAKTGDEQPEMKEFEVFPNPAHSNVQVQWAFEKASELTLRIESIDGKLLEQRQIEETGQTELDLSHFSNGLFFVKIQGEGVMEVKKFVKN